MQPRAAAAPVSLLSLRARSLGREALALVRHEPGAALCFGVLLALGGAYLASVFGTPAGWRALLGTQLAALAAVHASRGDARLLEIAGRGARRAFLAEYALLSLPFLAALLASRPPWPWGAASAAAPALLAAFPAGLLPALVRAARGGAAWRLPVPARAFEWAARLRENGAPLALVYLASAAFSRYPAVVLGGLVVLAWGASLFHVFGESRLLLEGFGGPPRRFLAEKVRRSTALLLAAAAPLALLLLARHPGTWPALLAVLAGCVAVHAGSVLARYALYREGRRMWVGGMVSLLVLSAAMLVPPVGLLLLHRLWRLALRRLEAYLG